MPSRRCRTAKPSLAPMAWALLAAALVLVEWSPAGEQKSAPATAIAGGKPIELVLSPYAGGPLRTLAVRMGDKDRPLLFDTGGGGTVLSKSIATELRLEPFGRMTGFRHDGERVDAPRAGPIKLSFGAFTRDAEVGVLDLDAMFRGMPSLAGITSLETFAGQTITVDFGGDRLWIETPESLAARIRDAAELAARSSQPAAGAGLDVFVGVKGKHGLQWFEVDSGNVAPVLIAPHAFAELGLAAISPNIAQNVVLDIQGLAPTTCNAMTKEMIYDGLLNAQFFMDHVVTFDLAKMRVWAKARAKK